MYGGTSGYSIGQIEIIGSGYTANQHAQLIATGNVAHHRAVVWGCQTFDKTIDLGPVIPTPIDATSLSLLRHSRQSLVDGITTAQLCKAGCYPNASGFSRFNQSGNVRLECAHRPDYPISIYRLRT